MEALQLDQFKEAKFWRQAVNECLGTMFWILLSCNQAAAKQPFAIGIAYIIVKHAMACLDGEGLHMFTPWTMYKILENKHLNPLKGVFWILMQMLGAYLGGLLANALNITFQAENNLASFTDASNGFRFFFALMFLLQVFHFCNNNAENSDIPASLMLIFGWAVSFWFMNDGGKDNFHSLNWVSDFAFTHQDAGLNGNMWVEFVWTLIVVVVAWVKHTYVLPAVKE